MDKKNWTTLKVFIKALSRVTDIPVSVDQPARSVVLANRLFPEGEFAIENDKYVYFWHHKMPAKFLIALYKRD
jgi:hypothetical protein